MVLRNKALRDGSSAALTIIMFLTLTTSLYSYAIDTGMHLNCSDELLLKATAMVSEGELSISRLRQFSDEHCFQTERTVTSPFIIRTAPVEVYRESLIRILENSSSTGDDIRRAYDSSLKILFNKLNSMDTEDSIGSDELLIFAPIIMINNSGVFIGDRMHAAHLNIIHSNNHSTFNLRYSGNVYMGDDRFPVSIEWISISRDMILTDHGRLEYSPSTALSKVMNEFPGLNVSGIELIDGPIYKIKVAEERRVLWIISKRIEYDINIDPQSLEIDIKRPWWYIFTMQ